jgi:hypothetical protein
MTLTIMAFSITLSKMMLRTMITILIIMTPQNVILRYIQQYDVKPNDTHYNDAYHNGILRYNQHNDQPHNDAQLMILIILTLHLISNSA